MIDEYCIQLPPKLPSSMIKMGEPFGSSNKSFNMIYDKSSQLSKKPMPQSPSNKMIKEKKKKLKK